MTYSDITLETYYSILLDAVRRYPATVGYDCKQPQTFRVLQLDHGAELQTPAMGATLSDKDTPYFYSRAWERKKFTPNNIVADYPVLTAFELSSDFTRGIIEKSMREYCFLEIAVLDSFKNECDGKVGRCESRTINHIFRDTKAILLNAINYISASIIARVGDVTGVYNRTILDRLLSSGEIEQYDTYYDIGDAFQSDNKEVRTTHVEMGATNTYGTKIRVKARVDWCLDVEFGGVNCVDPINQFQGC
jgi:hypothetical protein